MNVKNVDDAQIQINASLKSDGVYWNKLHSRCDDLHVTPNAEAFKRNDVIFSLVRDTNANGVEAWI